MFKFMPSLASKRAWSCNVRIHLKWINEDDIT